jgi:hypothetical protein
LLIHPMLIAAAALGGKIRTPTPAEAKPFRYLNAFLYMTVPDGAI